MAQNAQKSVKIFNRALKDKQKIFALKQNEYSSSIHLHEKTSFLLADRVADIKRDFKNCLEIGSGGSVGQIVPTLAELAPGQIENITLTANCEEMKKFIEYNLEFYKEEIRNIFPEEENRIPNIKSINILKDEETDLESYSSDTFDLIFFSSGVHWLNNLEKVFKDIYRILKPDGALLVSMAGNETLAELRTSLFLAEQERTGGASNRCSPLVKGDDLSSLLSITGYNLVTVDIERMQVKYPSAMDLMLDLRNMAEQSSTTFVQKPLNFDILLGTLGVYQTLYNVNPDHDGDYAKFAGHAQTNEDKTDLIEEHFGESIRNNDNEMNLNDSLQEMLNENVKVSEPNIDYNSKSNVLATFDIVHAIAWKPDPKQSKAKQPGSAQKGFILHQDAK